MFWSSFVILNYKHQFQTNCSTYILQSPCTQILCITFCGYRHNNKNIQMYAFTRSFTYSQSIHVVVVPYITFYKCTTTRMCCCPFCMGVCVLVYQCAQCSMHFFVACVFGISLFSQAISSVFLLCTFSTTTVQIYYSFSRHIQSSTSYFM